MEKLRLRSCSKTYLDSENIEAPFGSGIKLISATLNLNIGCIFFFFEKPGFFINQGSTKPDSPGILGQNTAIFLAGWVTF